MEYNFPITLDRQFKNKLEELHDKYGDEIMALEGLSPSQLDTCKFFGDFLSTQVVADATIDDNSNVSSRTVPTMLNEGYKPFLKLLSRNKVYIEMRDFFGKEVADEFLEKAVNGVLYEHDSHLSSYMPYCFAFSLKNIAERGLYFIEEMKADPPRHWGTFNHHTLEFISYATNMVAGAVGVPDYLIYAYYFDLVDTQGMSVEEAYKFRCQKFQEIVFNLNQPYLKNATQSAYTNFSILDEQHIAKFFADEKYPDGSYILDHLEGIKEFQKEFLYFAGDLRSKKWHTFPVISASLIFKDGEYADEDTARAVVRHNWKWGFNDVNIMNVSEATSISSCCRLVNNKMELNKNKVFNSIGGSDLNVGSTKVVTLNLARLAVETAEFGSDFLERVKENVELIHKYHYAQRNCLKKLINKGMLPLYSSGMMQLEDQFATVGITGLFEAMKVLGGITYTKQGEVFYNKRGYSLAKEMFNGIKEKNDKTITEYNYMSNVEQVPAESAAIKLCKKDRLVFGNRLMDKLLGEDCYIYGNQWIPLKENCSIFKRIESASLDSYCGGGAILHINLGENFNTFEDAWEFTVGLAKAGVGYFSYISKISICQYDHSFFGDSCPICGCPPTSYGIKVVGYMVKQSVFKKERRKEFLERRFYTL